MTIKDEIEKQYYSLLKLAEQYDSFFEKKEVEDWKGLQIKKGMEGDFSNTKEQLENEIPKFMLLIRESMETIPENNKKYNISTRTEPDGEEYIIKNYEDIHYSSLISFFQSIRRTFEDATLSQIKRDFKIYKEMRNIKTDVLSLSHMLTIFVPEKMISVQQQIDIIFKLRDKGLDQIADDLEEIDNEKDAQKKCLKARTALEKLLTEYIKSKGGEWKRSFSANLNTAIDLGLTEKDKRKAIASHYTFVSKIIHGDIQANQKNTQFAVEGILNIIGSLITT